MKMITHTLMAVSLLSASSQAAEVQPSENSETTNQKSTMTPTQVVEAHMRAFDGDDMDEIVADYADDVVFVLPNEVRQGKQAVYDFFAPQRMVENPPSLAYEILSSEGSVVVAPWKLGAGTPGEVTGRDVFVIENDKIKTQVVFIESMPG